MKTNIVKRADIQQCLIRSLSPSHYRDDGTCFCFCAAIKPANERDPDMRVGVCANCGQTLSRANSRLVGTTSWVCKGGVEHVLEESK